MATEQSTIDFLLDQLSGAGDMRARKMFGEYALYCDDKVVAFVCDDKIFLKITDKGRQVIKEEDLQPAYPGSKDYFHVSEDYWDDKKYLTELIQATAADLPVPKKKKS